MLWPLAPAMAVILYGTGDPSANTTAPAGTLAGSGWQYEGQFGSFLGTVVASNYFITAKHIGGSVGDPFTLNGVNYITTAIFPDPSSDLQIWQVSGTFPSHPAIFSAARGSETNAALVVFGRGTQRGNPVFVGNDFHLGGWLWGSSDGVQRWGTNIVGSIVSDPTYGDLLRVPFNAGVSANESHLSVGDSGGAVFVFNTTSNAWELAGINLAVDGPFSTTFNGTNPFDAAMFNTTGLFAQDDQGNWAAAPNPSAFYATEIAAHKGFIEAVIMQLVSVVSRKTHGNSDIFDIDLPETGAPGIECRSGGPDGNYMLVFTFTNNVSVQSAAITTGTGSATNFNVVGNQVTVNLTGVSNAQTIVVTLSHVSDGLNSGDVPATMGVLLGDVNASGRTDNGDAIVVRNLSGTVPSDTNSARADVNCSGRVDNGDAIVVRNNSGQALPSSP
jgi:Dockerin type I domain